MRRLFAFALVSLALAGGGCYAQAASSSASGGEPVVLDRVVAVINGDVLLQSDVDEEMRFAALEPFQESGGKDTRQSAMLRLINRSLILQQMKEQHQFNIKISDADAEKSLGDLRSHLPQCGNYDCKTAAGWKAFLAANDLTNEEVERPLETADDDFALYRSAVPRRDSHFAGERSGLLCEDRWFRLSSGSMRRLLRSRHVSARIHEVLLQQQVNGLLQDWLNSLRDEGSVQILDPAYAPSAGTNSNSNTAGEE